MIYYNEIDPFCAQWLRNLMVCNLLPEGDVDERSIEDVAPADLDGYASCHFFAGIGGWPLALRLAGWPDACTVWTGSCPCQPFSQAGRGAGFADKRHLWLAWHWLIGQCRPPCVMGEQVGGPHGLAWLDLVCADMGGCGYACRAIDLPAACVGAPHIRQRLWWLAIAEGEQRQRPVTECHARGLEGSSDNGGMGHAGDARLPHAEPPDVQGPGRRSEGRTTAEPSCAPDPWRQLEWLDCLDGKRRPTQSGLFPLAARLPGDVAKLRAYGNAIVPPLAAEVIRAFLDCAP